MLVADDIAVGPPLVHPLDDVFLSSGIEYCDGMEGCCYYVCVVWVR